MIEAPRDPKLEEVRKAIQMNYPSIHPNQVWSVKNKNGGILRRIRILALHPDRTESENDRQWIFQELASQMVRTGIGEISYIQEFNLRYVYELEDDE